MRKMKTFGNLKAFVAFAAFAAVGCNAFADNDDELFASLIEEIDEVVPSAGGAGGKDKAAAAPVSSGVDASLEEPAVSKPLAEAPADGASAQNEEKSTPAVEPREEDASASAPVKKTVKEESSAALTSEPDTLGEEPSEEMQAEENTKNAVALEPAKKLYESETPASDEALKDALRKTQELRFKAFKLQAEREIAEAEKCMAGEEYQDAVRHYALAMKLLSSSPALAGLRKKCQEGIAEGLYKAALQENATGRRDRALKLIQKAIDCRHPKARRQHEAWVAEGDPDANKADISEVSHRRNEEDYKSKRDENNKRLKRSQHYLSVRDLDRARDEVELVLDNDPYNSEALRLLEKIHKKRRTIMASEREVTRESMMADVDEAWRPSYAINVRDVEVVADTTVKPKDEKDEIASLEQGIINRMKEMRLPAISFKPPATLTDAIEVFRQASKDYDRPEIPVEQRGFNFYFKPQEPVVAANAEAPADNNIGFGADASSDAAPTSGTGPTLPIFTASDISFYDALKLVCESVNYKFTVKGPMVTIMHKDVSIEEMHTRSFPVLSSFMDRMTTAETDVEDYRANNSNNTGFSLTARTNTNNDSGENKEQNWKEFFGLMGVDWPEGSSIMYIKTLGKLRVRNTLENLAELENALNELNIKPTLIEIEARFVEVCQDDLNSLGFEWILNSDYTMGLGNHASKILGVKNGAWSSASGNAGASTPASGNTAGNNGGWGTTGGGTSSGSGVQANPGAATYANNNGATWIRGAGSNGSVGFSRTGGDTGYGFNNRYLSTLSNHISGEGYSTNDQFMKVNAFLGSADLSMILHMLSQRSDTDLLSAPKVLTRSEEQAVIKVVTLYRYPRDYDVQLQSSSSSSSSYGGGSQSSILAIVEPGEFETQEVGVILDVTPRLTDNGNLIDLQLNTQVIDEPTWKNYGMRIPFTGNSSLQNFEGIGGIFEGLTGILDSIGGDLDKTVKEAFAQRAVESATSALDSLTTSSSDNLTYYDAPMEQPFFHIRSIDSKVLVYPGATIVMGGLITEQRKAMDDKVPFLGDIPFVGRLFRSHSEFSSKRNLLIFLTTRLVDAHGREVKISAANENAGDANVKAAPKK